MGNFVLTSIIFSDDEHDVNNYLSNSYCCEFYEECREFITIDHYMAFHKAQLAGDDRMADLILETESVDTVKYFSQCIIKHDEIKWQRFRYSVLWDGLLLKFTQNPHLKYRLLLTGREKLIHTNKEDSSFGTWTNAHIKLDNQHYWRGCNILSNALMDIREAIMHNISKKKTLTKIFSEIPTNCKSCQLEDILNRVRK